MPTYQDYKNQFNCHMNQKTVNKQLWNCIDNVFNKCSKQIDLSKYTEYNNLFNKFPKLNDSFYNKDCYCQMTYKDLLIKNKIMNDINQQNVLPSRNKLLDIFDQKNNKLRNDKYFTCVNERLEDYDLDEYCKNTCMKDSKIFDQFKKEIDSIESKDYPGTNQQWIDLYKKYKNDKYQQSQCWDCLEITIIKHIQQPQYPGAFSILDQCEFQNSDSINQKIAVSNFSKQVKSSQDWVDVYQQFKNVRDSFPIEYTKCFKNVFDQNLPIEEFPKQFFILNACQELYQLDLNDRVLVDNLIEEINVNKKINEWQQLGDYYFQQKFSNKFENKGYAECLNIYINDKYNIDKFPKQYQEQFDVCGIQYEWQINEKQQINQFIQKLPIQKQQLTCSNFSQYFTNNINALPENYKNCIQEIMNQSNQLIPYPTSKISDSLNDKCNCGAFISKKQQNQVQEQQQKMASIMITKVIEWNTFQDYLQQIIQNYQQYTYWQCIENIVQTHLDNEKFQKNINKK